MFRRVLWVCVSIGYVSAALAATQAESLEKRMQQLQTMQANFTETVRNGQRITQQTSGMFWLKKPGKFFWTTQKPVHQDIIADGVNLWFYDKDLEQITVKKLVKGAGSTPALLLNGYGVSISRDYRVTKMVVGKGEVYTLMPLKRAAYRYLQMRFDQGRLTGMRFEDNLGQTTDFRFSNIKMNQPIPDSRFVFVPPQGVDIVHG